MTLAEEHEPFGVGQGLLDAENWLLTVRRGTDLRYASFQIFALKAILVAIGGLILGLGVTLIWVGSGLPSLIGGASQLGLTEPISLSAAFSDAFWFALTGLILFPVGLAILLYGIVTKKSPPETVSPKTGV
jgi:hypothetical protein